MGSVTNAGTISVSAYQDLVVNGDVTNSGGIGVGGPEGQAYISIGGRLTNTATGSLNLEGVLNGPPSRADVSDYWQSSPVRL